MASSSPCVACDKCCFGKICKDYLFDHKVDLFTKSLQRKKNVKIGEYLYHFGDPITHLIALRAGTVKIYNSDGNIVDVKTPGQLIGSEDLYADAYHFQAIAATEVQICQLERSRIYDLSQITENFVNYMTDILSSELSEQKKMISVLVSPDAQTKVKAYLKLIEQRYEHYGFSNINFSLPVTFKEMATLLGVSISSLNRSLSELKNNGEIIISRKNIQLINPTIKNG